MIGSHYGSLISLQLRYIADLDQTRRDNEAIQCHHAPQSRTILLRTPKSCTSVSGA